MTTHQRPALSVLDLVPVRTDQSSGDAIAASLSLARLAERFGYRRFWVAEHHNMPAVASTSPPLLVAMLAAATETMRVGSGAVLLPNHAPLVVAEQFAMLEAAHPGRIDLGIGRSSGTDGVTSQALRPGGGQHGVMSFPDDIDDVIAMMGPAGRTVDGRAQILRATTNPTSVPQVWLLGASVQSARAAGSKGMPYVFGHHLGVGGTAQALQAYRSSFVPSATLAAPQTVLPMHASIAETKDEAYRAALPWLLILLGLHTGRPQTPVASIEAAANVRLSPQDQRIVDSLASQWAIGTAEQVRGMVNDLAATLEVDEIMIHPVAGAHEGTDPRSSPWREQTLQLLAG